MNTIERAKDKIARLYPEGIGPSEYRLCKRYSIGDCGTHLNDLSSHEANIACLSTVTISSAAYKSPDADLAVWTASEVGRVKRSTCYLLLTLVGANSSCIIRCIKASSAREGSANTST